ncbi:MAG TPA: YfhO family protein [Paludibacteraceae bacterium]|nr:YfhO family protein [Paludibacteraceae bacterium]
MKKLDFKTQILPNLGILFIFIVAAIIYCAPALEGKIIFAGDNVNGTAASRESVVYHEQTGDYTWWTNSMFSGMPNYQVGGASYLSSQILKPFYRFFHWGHRNAIFIVLFYLISFFMLLRSFKINKWISLAGAFSIAFSSYFFIIIAASHHGKCTAITWMTMVIVGFLLIYQKKYGWGAIFTMFFIPMGFFIHPQMSYYICMLIGLLFFAELYLHLKEKRYKDLAIATILFALSFGVGMGVGSANIFANQEYAEQTMRGGHSELTKETEKQNTTKGLDLDYATAWSYGIGETMTFLIPNYMGGASGYNVGKESILYKELVANGVPRTSARDFCSAAPTYWGTQPFTSGPVYLGAIVCFLFILSLLVVKGPYKWALLAATLFSILLSWGHNFMPFTKLFFDYFPMYNKFRAVSSILIVAEITIPLLGFLALKEISNKSLSKEKLLKSLYISAGITAGIALLFALFGSMLVSFISPNDAQLTAQLPDWAYEAIIAQRASMLQADAWRSLLFIVLASGLVYLFIQEKIKVMWFGIILTGLIVTDMWPVNKRFCNDDNFVAVKKRDQAFAMQPYEKELLKDTTHFRVLNLTTNTFNEARTSYYLKSIGGYSAAKLRRYQDLIDAHISKMNMNALNMLNTKYVITQASNGEIIPQQNPDALGNAWFVDSLVITNTPNEESDALNTINIRTTAVLDVQYEKYITDFTPTENLSANITLTTYTPKVLEYESSSKVAGVAVFSEIYYPYGWKAYIDGEAVEHFRVNYLLRALNVPAGNHHIRFEFRPDSVEKGNMLSLIFIIIMGLTIVGLVGFQLFKWSKKRNN